MTINLLHSIRHRYIFWALLLPGILPGDEPSAGEKLFALKVKPLFAEKCNACHGDKPEKIKGKFDMRSRASTLNGGESYGKEVLIPGKGTQSFLYIATTRTEEDYEMPPKVADQLNQVQQAWIRDWINAGAPWPDDAEVARIQKRFAEGEQVVTDGAGQMYDGRRVVVVGDDVPAEAQP